MSAPFATLVRNPTPRRRPAVERNRIPLSRNRSRFVQRWRRECLPVRDLGASALEWAVIAAVVVVAASVIGGVVFNIVQTKSQALQTCASVTVGTSC